MSSPEGEVFYFGAERSNRSYGLIEPGASQFDFLLLEEESLQKFDALFDAIGRQQAKLGTRRIRLDHYFENHNEIRSVVEILNTDQEGTDHCVATSFITNPHGQTAIESHPSKEKNGVIIWEPEVGDSSVMPVGYDGYLLFGRVIYDCELQQSA